MTNLIRTLEQAEAAKLVKLVLSYDRAVTEARRAENANDSARIWSGGNRLALTRIRMIAEAKRIAALRFRVADNGEG